MPINRNEIKVLANIPVTFRLDRGAEGKEYPSKFENSPPRYMYTVNGESEFIYLPQVARNQLLKTRAAAGDMVRVLKSVAGDSTVWQVEVLSDAAEPVSPSPGPRVVAPQNQQGQSQQQQRTQGATALATEPQQSAFPQLVTGKMAMSLAAEIVAWGIAECKRLSIPEEYFEDVRATCNSLLIGEQKERECLIRYGRTR